MAGNEEMLLNQDREGFWLDDEKLLELDSGDALPSTVNVPNATELDT